MNHFEWQFLIQYIMLIIGLIPIVYFGLLIINMRSKKRNVTKTVTNEKELEKDRIDN